MNHLQPTLAFKNAVGLVCLLLALLCIQTPTFAKPADKDYTEYHKSIINAEYAIFIQNDSIGGLKIYKQVFDNYDFAFVDDCLVAFQLALVFKKEDYAMAFIKKALDNGFELKLLDELSVGCACTHYSDRSCVRIHEAFISKNRKYLEVYAKEAYPKYIQRIDKDLLAALIKHHVKEQLYKNYHAQLGFSMDDQWKEYLKVTDDNLAYMDSLANKKIFVGEQNLGIYTNKQAEYLKMPFGTIENCLALALKNYRLPPGTFVPIITEGDYYEFGPVYNMQFHNPKTYNHLSVYKDEAIKKGYLHPREYASLKFNDRKGPHDDLFLQPTKAKIIDTKEINERRKQLLLPGYEIDYNKHAFAHAHNLQLCFGMFNGTR